MARMKIPGTVYRRANGKWAAQSPEMYDPTKSKWRRRTLGTFGTKNEAEEALARHNQQDIQAGSSRMSFDVKSQRIDDYLDEWLQINEDKVASGQLARRTATGYESAVRLHIKPALGRLAVGDLNSRALLRWLADLRETKGLADRTVRRLYWTLSGAIREARLSDNPARLPDGMAPVVVNKKETYRPRATEIRQFLEHVGECPRSQYVHPLWRLAASTGMRRGELIAVTWGDLDLEERRLRIERSIVMDGSDLLVKPPKSEAGNRTVGIDPTTASALESYRWRLRQELGDSVGARPRRWVSILFSAGTHLGRCADLIECRPGSHWSGSMRDCRLPQPFIRFVTRTPICCWRTVIR